MDDVNHSYPPGTIVFWSLSTNDTGEAKISWFRKGAEEIEQVNVPGGVDVRWTVEHQNCAVVIGWSTPHNVYAHMVGAFDAPVQAGMFASRVKLMLTKPYEWLPEAWNPERGIHIPGFTRPTPQPATLNPPADEIASLVADAERYRRLSTGETVDNERLVNASSYEVLISRSDKYDALQHGREVDGLLLVGKNWHEDRAKPQIPDGMVMVAQSTYDNLARESQRYHQLLNGDDVDGKLLLDVDVTRRLQRMENAVKSVFSVLDDMLTTGDVDHLGYELNTD